MFVRILHIVFFVLLVLMPYVLSFTTSFDETIDAISLSTETEEEQSEDFEEEEALCLGYSTKSYLFSHRRNNLLFRKKEAPIIIRSKEILLPPPKRL